MQALFARERERDWGTEKGCGAEGSQLSDDDDGPTGHSKVV